VTRTVVKCLLVDDLEENLLALTALLSRADVHVLQARSGVEALELLLAHDVALAIIDVQMPGMDGFELAELMRGSERTRHVPIILVTAGVRDQHRLFTGYDIGAVDFLYKPIEPRILANKAEVFFQLYRQKQQLVQELNERTETLRLNEMFAAVLGHDLRTPLGAIITAAQLLELHAADDLTREIAARTLSSGKRMNRLIDDMLDFARARLAGGIPLNRAAADLGALVQRAAQEHQTTFPDRRIDINCRGDLNGHWDADRLAQVVSNIIGNALQHGRDGEPVQVRLDGIHPDAVTREVVNAGPIDPSVLPRLFEPFRGGRRQNGRHEGLALGLYIAQHIVHAHDGRIAVDAENGTHAVFSVTVPRQPPTLAANRSPRPANRALDPLAKGAAHRQPHAVLQLHREVAVALGKEFGDTVDPYHGRSMDAHEQ
jgi:two-component system, sensor histidine kinase and response regulator